MAEYKTKAQVADALKKARIKYSDAKKAERAEKDSVKKAKLAEKSAAALRECNNAQHVLDRWDALHS